MDIKEFVSETLVQICEGVVDAQNRTQHTGAIISPRMTGKGEMAIPEEISTGVDVVNFDIAVEARASNTQKDDAGGKVSISIACISARLGADGSDTRADSSASISRVRFTVHACWPVQKLTPMHRAQLEGEPISSQRY